MGKCKHPARVWLWWACDDMQYAYFTAQRAKGLGWSWFGRGLGDPHARWCAACGAWLSLGPSNDTPEVCVEIRAAEIAATWREYQRTHLSSDMRSIADGAEIAGWIEARFDSAKVPEQDGEWAGWLAQTIATHDTDRAGEGGLNE